MCLKLSRILTAAIQFLALHSTDHPAIRRLISDTGIKGQTVGTAGHCAAGVRLQHLRHAGNGVAARSQLCCVGDGIAHSQRVDLSKMIVYAAVVSGDTHISIPNAGVIEMPGTFFQCGAVRTFIDLDDQTNRRNFQCSQTAVAVIKVRGNRSVCRAAPAAAPGFY